MADLGQRTGHAAAPTYADPGPTGWTAWVVFAGVIMILAGSFQAIQGLVALFEDDYYAVNSSGLVVHVDYTGWGWTHLILGVLICGAGFGAIAGQTWARVVGVVLAVGSALVNMAFMAAYPVWSITIIALDVVVIYSLIVHGRELKS